jgi:hypothetical protein
MLIDANRRASPSLVTHTPDEGRLDLDLATVHAWENPEGASHNVAQCDSAASDRASDAWRLQ